MRLDIAVHHLPERARFDANAGPGKLTVVVARGGIASVACDTPALLVPLRGRLRICGRGGQAIVIAPGSALVPLRSSEARAASRDALWAAVVGDEAAWRPVLTPLLPAAARPVLCAGLQPDARGLRRTVLGLLRRRLRLQRGRAFGSSDDEAAFAVALARSWHGHREAIERCPGRTLAQRAKVYARLQAVRLHMLAHGDDEVSIDRLAALAGYSPTHFMRTFHAAFGETVHGFLTRARLAHARWLLAGGAMAVAEAAIAAGFDDRGTFSRQFRRHFGITADDWRRRHLRAPAAAAVRSPRERMSAVSGTSTDSLRHGRERVRA